MSLRTSIMSIVGQGQPISVVNCSRVAGDEPAHLSPQPGIAREKPGQSALSAAPRLHSSAGAHDRSEVLAATLMHGLGLALFRLRTHVQRVGRRSKRERLSDRLQTQAILGPVRPTVMRRAMAALDDSQSVNPMRPAANGDHDGTTPAHPPLPPPWPRRACADAVTGRAPEQPHTHARAVREHRCMTHDPPNPAHAGKQQPR